MGTVAMVTALIPIESSSHGNRTHTNGGTVAMVTAPRTDGVPYIASLHTLQ